MLKFWVIALAFQSLLGQYVNIENQSYSDLIDRGDINLSVSLRNSDTSIDIKTGIKVSFEIIPSSSYEVGSQGKWEYDTIDGIVDNISINQNCKIAFVVVVKAVGYTSATSSSFERISNSCTNKLIIESSSSVHILQPFLVNIQLTNIEIPNQLYIKELGNNFISDLMSLSDITLNYSFEIYFDTPGTKYLYAIYNGYLINSVTIEVSYCILEIFHTLEDTNTVFKAFIIQVQFNNDDGMCEFCIGNVALFTSPSIIVNGDSSSNVESLITNCEAEFNDLSVSISGDYSFIIDSNYIENSYTIGTKKFEKAKLKIAFIEEPVDVSTFFSINIQIMSFDFISVIIVAGIEINVILEPSVTFSDNPICTTINGKCDFSNLLIQTPGIYQLIASCNECDNDHSENFKVICYLKVELDDDKIDFSTENEIYIITSIYYDSGLNTLFISGQHTFIFVFSPEITKEYGNTINDGLIFTTIKIPSEGTYIISVSAENCFSTNSVTVNIKNYYINGTVIPENSKTGYPLFGISFDTYQDVNLLTKETSIEFIINTALYSSKTKLIGVTKCTTISGNCHLSGLTIATNGAYKLKASGNRLITWIDSNQIIVPCQKYLSITNLNPLPATTETVFSLEIIVFTTIDLIAQDISNFYNIMISITSDTYSEIKSTTTNNGLVQFNDLIILAEGTFKITTYTINAFYSEKTDIIIKNYYIIIAPSPETPFKNYTLFAFYIQLYEDIGLQTLSPNNFELTIEFTPIINIVNPFNAVFAGGFLELNDLIATTDDIYTIKVSGLKIITESYTFEVETCYLTIQFHTNEPAYHKNAFSVLVEIHRNENELYYKSWEIFLDLEPNGKLIGAISATTEIGSILFKSLSIEDLGTYRLKVSGSNLLTIYSKEFSVGYCYLKIAFMEERPSNTESIFSVKISAYSDPNLISLAFDFTDKMTLYVDPVGNLSGIVTKNATFLTVFDNLNIISENTYTLLVESDFANLISTEIFEIKNYYLNFSFTSLIPKHTGSVFSGEVVVFIDYKMTLICISCSFDIKINIDNNGLLTGNSSTKTSNGIAYFNDLQIKTEGNYMINITSKKAIDCKIGEIFIKDYYLYLNYESKFKVISKKDLNTKTLITFSVYVYESNTFSSLYKEVSYYIKLNIIPNIPNLDLKDIETYKGLASFSNLQINQIGNYTIYASGQGLFSSNPIELNIKNYNFSWFSTVDKQDNLLISFEKDLYNSLAFEDFSISNEKSINLEFSLQPKYLPIYNFTIITLEPVPENIEICIKVTKKNIKSIDNFYFDYSPLYVNLSNASYVFPSAQYIKTIVSATSTTTYTVWGSVLVVGLISSPSFLWALMNTKDILAYLPLNRIPYTERVVEAFPTVGTLNFAYNPGKYIFTLSSSPEPYLEARHFGIKTTYFLHNCGMWFTFLILYVSVIPIIYIGTHIKKDFISKKCETLLSNYRYSFFLRFWVQGYMNLGFLSIVQLRSEFSSEVESIANFAFASIFAVKNIQILFLLTPIFLFIFQHVNYKRLKEDEIFRKRWGGLGAEFKNDKGIMSTQYYTIFTLRRVGYVISQIFLNDVPNMQNSLNIVFSFMQLLFIIVFRPFNDRVIMVQTILEEACIILIMIASFFFINDSSLQKLIIIEAIIVFSLFAMLFVNGFLSVILILLKVKELLAKILKKKVVEFVEIDKNVQRVHPEKGFIVDTYGHNQTYEKIT